MQFSLNVNLKKEKQSENVNFILYTHSDVMFVVTR